MNDVEKEYIAASVIDQSLLLLVLFAKTFEGRLSDLVVKDIDEFPHLKDSAFIWVELEEELIQIRHMLIDRFNCAQNLVSHSANVLGARTPHVLGANP